MAAVPAPLPLIDYVTPIPLGDNAPAGAAKTNAAIKIINTSVSQNYVALSTFPGIDPTGLKDSWQGFVNALAFCAGTNLKLWIDCVAFLAIGTDSTRTIFIPNNSYVECAPGGRLRVDNIGVQAFAFVHTVGWHWRKVRIEYIAGTSPSAVGSFGQTAVNFNPGSAFSNVLFNGLQITCTNYLAANFGNTFSSGGAYNISAPVAACAIISINGACNHGEFDGLTLYVPDGVSASRFIPCGIALFPQWAPGTAVTSSSVIGSGTAVTPNDIIIRHLKIDGCFMGVVGGATTGLIIDGPMSIRYSDMQDDSGGNVGGGPYTPGGGVPWFPPPHFHYIEAWSSAYGPLTGRITNFHDQGVYVGTATRRAGAGGFMHSLKVSVSSGMKISGVESHRPDGLLDLFSDGWTNQGFSMENVSGTFDSSVVTADASIVPGVRFPAIAIVGFDIDGVVVRDLNPNPTQFPIEGFTNGNADCSITNLKVYLNDWSGANYPGFSFPGRNMTLKADYYFESYSSTQTGRGPIANQSSFYGQNSHYEINFHGFRRYKLTLTGNPASGDTSATLSNPSTWSGYGTVACRFVFGDGSVRYGTLTDTSASITWGDALTAAQTSAVIYAENVIGANLDQFKPRFLLAQTGLGVSNYAKLVDTTNGWTAIWENGKVRIEWNQWWVGTPTGSTFTLPITYPGSFVIDEVTWGVYTALDTTNGLTTVGVGWSGSATALLAAQAIAANTASENPPAAVSLGGSSRTLLLTPTAGTFGTTGKATVAVRAVRVEAGF